MDDFLARTISHWTLPGGMSATDDDDQRRLIQFLKDFPQLQQAWAQRMAGTAPPAPAEAAVLLPASGA